MKVRRTLAPVSIAVTAHPRLEFILISSQCLMSRVTVHLTFTSRMTAAPVAATASRFADSAPAARASPPSRMRDNEACPVPVILWHDYDS